MPLRSLGHGEGVDAEPVVSPSPPPPFSLRADGTNLPAVQRGARFATHYPSRLEVEFRHAHTHRDAKLDREETVVIGCLDYSIFIVGLTSLLQYLSH